MHTEAEMLSLVDRLAKAKGEQNIAAALAVYHSEALMEAPGFAGLAKGHGEIDRQLKVFFSLIPDYRVELERHAFNDQVMLATGSVFATLNIRGKKCPSICLPAFFEFHFTEQRISKEVFHLDVSLICRKSGVTIEDLFLAMASYAGDVGAVALASEGPQK